MPSSLKPMHRIFDDETLEELKELYQTGLYTKTDLAAIYTCSVTTICLWLNPDEQVRIDKFRSRTTRTKCECGKVYEEHKKCEICKIHTHTEEELKTLPEYYKYGRATKSQRVCDTCYEEYKDKTIQLTGYYKLGPNYEEYTITVNPYTKEITI